MDTEIIAELARRFGLDRVETYAPMPGTRNRNYVLRAASGAWFARRRFPGYCGPQWLAFDVHAALFLAAQGVPVAAPLPARDGEHYWRDRDEVWQLFPYVLGESFPEGDEIAAAALGAAVACFHARGGSFRERCDKLGPRGETCPLEIRRIADRIEQETPACAAPLERYRMWIDAAARALPDAAYAALPHALVHGDLQPANVVMRDGRVAALVDLDWCAWRPRIYDLAFAILFCCAAHATPIRGDDVWSLTQPPLVQREAVEAFLDAYAADAGALAPPERQALRAQIALSWCHSRIAGALKVPPEARSAFLDRASRDLESLAPEDF